ncbi:PilW family protein [Motilimonas sp. 1_MG-2023]|uniref:PilW family protein n=1 Tax=Motilimonas sp. 1_MG-2023 TaxID=3062672 RepID=UPI0034DF15AE
MRRTRLKQRGFGIIEWMIGMTIGLFLIGGITAVFVQSRAGSQNTNQMGELQETGRIALQLISQDLRQVGFWGVATSHLMTRLNATVNKEITTPTLSSSSDCTDDLGGGSFPKGSVQFRQFWSFEIPQLSSLSYMRCIIDDDPDSQLKRGSDVITLKRLMGKREPIPAAGTVTADGPFLLMGSHSKAAIFASGSTPPSDPSFTSSHAWQYLHHVYFLDRSLSTNTPRLRRMSLNNSGMALEPILLSGVEDMQLLYIVEEANGNTNYQTSALSNDKVIGVEVFILVRALEESKSYLNQNTYTLADKTITVNDNFRRLLVSSVISFSNPMWLDKAI